MVMGANYRSQYHPKMVGVTGSVGKTTTKQMTYAALSGFGETIKTEGNPVSYTHLGSQGLFLWIFAAKSRPKTLAFTNLICYNKDVSVGQSG